MDQVGICNLALGWLGASLITSVDDASTQAELCKANWDAVRDAVLEQREWTFAVARVDLAADAEAPAFGWTARYPLPAECIRVLTADDGSGYADFEWVREGGYILASQASPVFIRYLKRVEDPAQWSASFGMAMAYRLAATLAVPLSENRSAQGDLWALYQKSLDEAGRRDGMQGRSESVRSSSLAQKRW